MNKKIYLIGSVVVAGFLALGALKFITFDEVSGIYSKKQLSSLESQTADEALVWLKARFVDQQTGQPISNEKLAQINNQISKMKISKAISFEPQGPDNIGGRTRAIQVDRTNNNRLWAGGVSGGIFVSNNRGNFWERLDSYINAGASPYVASMTQTIDGVLYVATGSNEEVWGGNGVWYTTDFGQTWEKIPGTSNCTEVESSNADNYVWLATAQGLKKWKLGDASLTSTSVSSGACQALKVSKDGQVIVAAFGSNKTFVSTDGGESFNDKSGLVNNNLVPSGSGRIEYAISGVKKADSTYSLYAVRTSSNSAVGGSNLLGMHVSKDNGITWKQFVGASGPPSEFDIYRGQGTYNSTVTVRSDDPTEILIGGIDIWKWKQTVDDPLNGPSGGFEKVSQWFVDPSSTIYVHADNHEMKWDALNRLYVGNDGGIGVTDNAGLNWYPSNRGYNVTQFYGIAFDREGAVMGGTQDNGTLYNDHTLSTFQEFREVNGGDGFECEISHFNPKVMFSSVYYNSISRSGDRGVTWSSFTPDLPNSYPVPGTEGTAYHPFHTEFILAEHFDLNSKDSVTYVATKNYDAGDLIRIPSLSSGDSMNYVTPTNLYFDDTLYFDPTLTVGNENYGKNLATGEVISMGSDTVLYNVAWDTLRIQDPFQSWFLVYVGANGGELWGTRNALRLSAANAQWVCVARGFGGPGFGGSNFNSNIDIEFSRDLEQLYIATGSGVTRVSGLGSLYSSDPDFTTKAGFGTGTSTATPTATSQTKITSASYEGIAVNPNNSNDLLLLAGFNGTNRRTTNASTATNTNLNAVALGSITSPGVACYDGIIDRLNEDVLVVGTSSGVFVSENGGASWENASAGFEGTPVFEVRQQWRLFDEGGYRSGEIYIGTYGRGIWSSAAYLGIGNNGTNNAAANFKTKLKAYPNPANESTTLSFQLAKSGDVELAVYSITGRLVKSLTKNNLSSGENTIHIDCDDIPNGTYIVKFVSGKQVESVKFIKM
jgi:ligand-binding sensor domain-containing protein